MQPVPALGSECVLAERFVRRGAPQLRAHVVVLGEQLLRVTRRALGGAAEQDGGAVAAPVGRSREAVDAARDAVADVGRHRRLHVVLVVEGEVVEDVVGIVAVHPP